MQVSYVYISECNMLCIILICITYYINKYQKSLYYYYITLHYTKYYINMDQNVLYYILICNRKHCVIY